MSILRRIILFLLVALAAIALALISSRPVIIPPSEPINPVAVYVIDTGLHSRLVLPDHDDGLIQYAYGDWRYFALNQQDLGSAVAALLIPTPGTLGRRKYDHVADLEQNTGVNSNLLSLTVAEAKVTRLRKLLAQRFYQNIETQIFNSLNQMHFVQDDLNYTLYHNSNHELVVWLQDLGCSVEGFVLWANFKISHFPKNL